MGYHSYLILPTSRIIKTFHEETFVLTDVGFELEYILSKLVELIDEAQTLRGESPANHHWQEAFVTSVHYDGMADYYDAYQDSILSGALRKLYRSILTVFMHHAQQLHPDDNIAYCRLLNGDLITGLFRVQLITRADVEARHNPPTIPGPVPWRH